MPVVPYWHVDAFADAPFTGNQAAVMILEAWPEDAILQAIGEENNFAETAFLVRDQTGASDWELRWFTPACEIRLCGHATLASGHVLLAKEPEATRMRFRTRQAGILEVRAGENGLEVGLPLIETAADDWAEAVNSLGGPIPSAVWRSKDRYNVFLYEDEGVVRGLSPDFAALAALGDHQFIATAPGADYDVVSRVFVPGAGVPEDSVTGSAHAVLTHFWSDRLGRDSFTAFQASSRGGRVTCRRDGSTAWLGGGCVTVVEGQFTF